MKQLLILVVTSLTWSISFAQSSSVPVHSENEYLLQRFEVRYGNTDDIHTSHRGYERKQIAEYAEGIEKSDFYLSIQDKYNIQYLKRDNAEWLTEGEILSKKPVLKYFYRSPANLFHVDTKSFSLKVNPVIQFQMAYAKQDSVSELNNSGDRLFINSRGLELRGVIKKKIGFYAAATDNQSRSPVYYQEMIKMNDAVPGFGYYKLFKTTGVDHFDTKGNVMFEIYDYVHAEFGYGKNFLGNGYRSLMLSDFGANYLYLKLNTRVWKLDYQNLFTEFILDYDGPNSGPGQGDTLLQRKYGAFHHLSLNVNSNLNFGLFEGVMFSRQKHFELEYLVPVIFYRAIEQQLGSPDNVVLGLDAKYNLFHRAQIYAQFVLDDINIAEMRSSAGWWGNKWGFQLGAKGYDIYFSNLDALVELNIVRPYMYAHNSELSNYTHYNQPLAHPSGANFKEFIGMLRYKPLRNLTVQAKYIYSVFGADSSDSNWGGNIFMPYIPHQQDYGNKVAQGVATNLTIADFLISYEWKHNINLDLNIVMRNSDSVLKSRDRNSTYVGLGIRINTNYKPFDF